MFPSSLKFAKYPDLYEICCKIGYHGSQKFQAGYPTNEYPIKLFGKYSI